MLTDTIMYDCIEYLLRDKSDEESLECLCRLLRTIGKELDGKANEKVKEFLCEKFIFDYLFEGYK
jgi:translation initiation factor 4G